MALHRAFSPDDCHGFLLLDLLNFDVASRLVPCHCENWLNLPLRLSSSVAPAFRRIPVMHKSVPLSNFLSNLPRRGTVFWLSTRLGSRCKSPRPYFHFPFHVARSNFFFFVASPSSVSRVVAHLFGPPFVPCPRAVKGICSSTRSQQLSRGISPPPPILVAPSPPLSCMRLVDSRYLP